MIESLVIVLPFILPREKRVRKKYHYKVSLGVSVCLHISYIWVVTSQPLARVAARLVSYCFCCDATAPLCFDPRISSTGNVCIKISTVILIIVYLACLQPIRRILVHIF